MKNCVPMELPELRFENGDLNVEFICEIPADLSGPLNTSDRVRKGLSAVEGRLQPLEERLASLNLEIDRLTSHADGLDIMFAVASGVLAGLVDSLWVGTFDFEAGKVWSNQTVNDFVMKMAKLRGYEGDRLDGAISALEREFQIPSDSTWKDKDLGISARSHHLDDLAHHPSPIGLIVSILTQFTKTAYFQNGDGFFLPIQLDGESGDMIGDDLRSKLFAGSFNWFMHLVSDMSGSNKTAGAGMGIPGPILSMLKEFSGLPGVNRMGMARQLKDAFVKEKFDLRSELAVVHELRRQALPVLMNEVLVRVFYFFRRLLMQRKERGAWSAVEWKAALPWKNRTIIRMLTIAHGTFVAVDLADAAIRGAISSGGELVTFAKEFLLRVNVVGVGRFAVAVYSDTRMGIQRAGLRNERILVNSERIHLLNAKAYYLQAESWIASESTYQALCELQLMMEAAANEFTHSLHERMQAMERVGDYKEGLEGHNPGLIADITNQFKF